MTRRVLSPEEVEAYGRLVVTGRSLGYCQISGSIENGGGHKGTEWMHRVARGRGGSFAPVNGILGCSYHHRLTHAHPRLARRCGWMVDTGAHPSTVPALIWTQAGPGWWWLDVLEDGRSAGLAVWCDPADVPDGMWTGTLAEAVAQLEGRAVA